MSETFRYKEIENYVRDLFHNQVNPRLIYHTLDHTIHVVERTKEIAAHYRLDEKDMFIVYTAAWFHDTGYLINMSNHEESSVQMMYDFMQHHTNDTELLKQIENCILATRNPKNPQTLLEQILCDADTYHLGTKNFKQSNKQVRQELELTEGYIDRYEWTSRALNFLKTHEYYTAYCKQLLEKRKQKNIAMLEEKLKTMSNAETGSLPLLKQKNPFMTKGIQTMLRLTSDNHLELSGMADQKASILISVNAIIISVVLSVLVRRLDIERHLTIPTILFLSFSVCTIVIAILATRPKITEGTFSDADIAAKKTNLLFFGNFYKVSLEEYQRAMRTMMGDTDYLYGSLIKDIYYLGIVLGKKYKLVRLAYTVFMIGIIISVLAFGIAMVYASSAAQSINSNVSPF